MKQIPTFLIVLWLAGVVVVKGFWLTLLAAIFPPFGMYLAIEAYIIPFFTKLMALL